MKHLVLIILASFFIFSCGADPFKKSSSSSEDSGVASQYQNKWCGQVVEKNGGIASNTGLFLQGNPDVKIEPQNDSVSEKLSPSQLPDEFCLYSNQAIASGYEGSYIPVEYVESN